MLHFQGKPPFSFEKFLNKCQDLIPQKDMELISGLHLTEMAQQKNETIKRLAGFEILLRNELVKLRAVRKKVPPEKYLRPDGYAGASVYHVAVAAQRNPSSLEAERMLDRARWDFLDELSTDHYFDLDLLVIYGLKLLILERWEKIDKADKQSLLDNLITANQ